MKFQQPAEFFRPKHQRKAISGETPSEPYGGNLGAIRQKPYPMAPTSEHSAVVDSLRHPGLYTRIRAGPDPFAIKKAPSGRDRYGPSRQEVAGRPLPSTGKRAMEVWSWRTWRRPEKNTAIR